MGATLLAAAPGSTHRAWLGVFVGDWILRLSLERLRPNAPGEALAPIDRVIYCIEGSATIKAPDATETILAERAWSGDDRITVEARDAGATLLRWELRTDDETGGRVVEGDGRSTTELQACPVSLPGQECLMRCDRVEFPPGGVAYLHTHRGPGIRCLLTGELTVLVHGKARTMKPMQAWFENGSDPVRAQASLTETTAFVRVMTLPLAILGKPSISYVDPADKDKPKPQRYTVFVDRPLTVGSERPRPGEFKVQR